MKINGNWKTIDGERKLSRRVEKLRFGEKIENVFIVKLNDWNDQILFRNISFFIPF